MEVSLSSSSKEKSPFIIDTEVKIPEIRDEKQPEEKPQIEPTNEPVIEELQPEEEHQLKQINKLVNESQPEKKPPIEHLEKPKPIEKNEPKERPASNAPKSSAKKSNVVQIIAFIFAPSQKNCGSIFGVNWSPISSPQKN